ncbi:hypothetical protein BST81_16780 [Leptolyngbya sp. 'hensonii']|nr:hypothetical protein BST81_16780 [Leptolyngbya sp. 'hensonii']
MVLNDKHQILQQVYGILTIQLGQFQSSDRADTTESIGKSTSNLVAESWQSQIGHLRGGEGIQREGVSPALWRV